MSSQQETMRTSIGSANSGKQSTVAAAITTAIAAEHASGVDSGYLKGFGTNNATYVAAVASANAALASSRATAEMTKLATIAVAKDVLRNATGEIPF